jgi:hypothetical protein
LVIIFKPPSNYPLYIEYTVTRILQTSLALKHFILGLSGCDTCPPTWSLRPVAFDVDWASSADRATDFVVAQQACSLTVDEGLESNVRGLRHCDSLGPPF